jgi:hypothetical protein
MVARLNTTEKMTTIIEYNEQKVLQNVAELIFSNGFLTDPARLDTAEKLDRFRRQNELDNRSEVNMLHATVNFDPGEVLSKQQFCGIAHRFMKGLNMDDQPYLVYQHHDAGHPHLHIVASLITAQGTRIKTDRMAERLSEPTRKAIEQEFGLIRAGQQQEKPALVPDQVPKVTYGHSTGTKAAMRDILQMVTTHYNFTSLQEYNAILREYNVFADRGKPGSATFEHGGLVYRVTDEEGKKKSAPVKASAYSFKPTLPNLEKQFVQNQQTREQQTASLRQKLDLALFQGPASLEELAADLRKEDIAVREPKGDPKGHPPDLIYVDHQLRIAVDARQLGPAYTHQQLEKVFDGLAQSPDIQHKQDLGRRMSR